MKNSEQNHNQTDDTDYIEGVYQESIKERAEAMGIPIEQMREKMDGMFHVIVPTNPNKLAALIEFDGDLKDISDTKKKYIRSTLANIAFEICRGNKVTIETRDSVRIFESN